MTVLLSTLLALALVPAPRDYAAAEGVCSVTSRVAYSVTDWYDFDRIGACLSEVRVTERTDRSLPAEGYRLAVRPDGVTIAAAECLWLGTARPGYEDFRRRMKEHRIRLMDMNVNCATFAE